LVLLPDVGVTLVVTVVVAVAPGALVVVVFVVVALFCAATAGVATSAIAAIDAIRFFIASSTPIHPTDMTLGPELFAPIAVCFSFSMSYRNPNEGEDATK